MKMFVQGYTMFILYMSENEKKLPLVKRSGHQSCCLRPPHTCVIQSLFEIRINGSHEGTYLTHKKLKIVVCSHKYGHPIFIRVWQNRTGSLG